MGEEKELHLTPEVPPHTGSLGAQEGLLTLPRKARTSRQGPRVGEALTHLAEQAAHRPPPPHPRLLLALLPPGFPRPWAGLRSAGLSVSG